jgi:hypothetical protein
MKFGDFAEKSQQPKELNPQVFVPPPHLQNLRVRS